jgi:hypothetical protein
VNIDNFKPRDIWEKLPKDCKLPSKGEECKEDFEQKGNSEKKENSKNKEDSQKCFWYGSFENETTSNIGIN